jgi:methanogenic corrinoid protein MtbC1
LPEVIRYLRDREYTLVHPELIGLPATVGTSDRVLQRAQDPFRDAVLAGDADRCRQVLFDLYLAKHPVGAICDHVIAPAFHDVGRLWECGDVQVYQERRGCEICMRALYDLRSALPSPAPTAPLAIGGTAEGDRYTLPTTMSELVLRGAGWRAVSLGASLPMETVIAAVHQQKPRLVWLSVSHLEDEGTFVENYTEAYHSFDSDVAVALGGRALSDQLRHKLTYTVYCDNMQHLESFARTMFAVSGSAGTPPARV